MELAVEKENEEAIQKHKYDLTDRLQQLNEEVLNLENKQKMVSALSNCLEFVCVCS